MRMIGGCCILNRCRRAWPSELLGKNRAPGARLRPGVIRDIVLSFGILASPERCFVGEPDVRGWRLHSGIMILRARVRGDRVRAERSILSARRIPARQGSCAVRWRTFDLMNSGRNMNGGPGILVRPVGML
jgi:hypothetical protein